MTPDTDAQPGEVSPADGPGPRELLRYRSAQGRWVEPKVLAEGLLAAAPLAGDKWSPLLPRARGKRQDADRRVCWPRFGSAKAGSVVGRGGQDVPTAAPGMASRPRLLTMTMMGPARDG